MTEAATEDSFHEDDPYGLRHGAGGPHYRAYVGPPEDYDLISGIVFSLLFAAGMRETHRVLDVGCGSLRIGRLLIPYLRPRGYYGIEPNEWLVEEGLAKEVGADLAARKQPAFRYVDDFSADGFGVPFDWIFAQSIFSHTFDDLAIEGFQGLAAGLGPDGLLFATYREGERQEGSGWLYPGCTDFQWAHIEGFLDQADLQGVRLAWPHPRQQWFVAGRADQADRMHGLAERLALQLASAQEPE